MLQNPINQSAQQQQLDEGEAKKRQRGTGFANISRILGANVGAGQRMGAAIGGQLSQQAEQIRKGIEQGQSVFEAGLKKGTSDESGKIATATGAVTGIMDKTGSPTFTTPPKSINAQPTKPGYSEMLTPGTSPIASAEPDYEKIGRELRGAEYAGPKNIENIQQQQQRAANLATLGRLSGLSGGQEELLRSQVASRGRYGLGQSALDAMLLGKEGQKQLEAARSQTGAVATQAGQAESAAQTQAQAAQSSIEANKLAALEKIQKEYGGIQEKGTEQAKQFVSDINKLKQLFDPRNFTKQQLDEIQGGKNPEAQKLLERAEAGEFGDIKGLMGQLYTGDPAALQNTLNSIVASINPSAGGRYYQGQQQTQAQHLAELMSGAKAGENIAKEEYKTKLFNPNEGELKGILESSQGAKDRAIANLKSQDLAPLQAAIRGEDWSGNIAKIDPRLRSVIDEYLDSIGQRTLEGRGNVFKAFAEQLILPEFEKAMASKDYEKDERISAYNKDPFSMIRQNLGIDKKEKITPKSEKILSEQQIQNLINRIKPKLKTNTIDAS